MTDKPELAPGGPGIPPRWTSSAKQGTGTALSPSSRVWFTVSHGIFNEIYYPRVDQACTRDMGMLVTAEDGFFSEEKRGTVHRVELLAPGVPGYRLSNTCEQGRYRIVKEIVTDPDREVVLQHTVFSALSGSLEDYHLHVLLAPHVANRGWGNTAWVDDYKGIPLLFAQRDDTCLALACSAPWLGRSAGYVGTSDGWQDLSRNRRMTWSYARAEDGNVALTGEIDLGACEGQFVLALGFGRTSAEAGNRARSSLAAGFERVKKEYVGEWQEWQSQLRVPASGRSELGRFSASILQTHEDKGFPGGMIASLSIPWGFAKGDDDLGGYHLVWARDLVEIAGGLLAVGAHAAARRVVRYLASIQEKEGHWPQNTWLDGTPYWGGVQMDETALPILLVDLARREHALDDEPPRPLWDMVRRAAGYLVRNGPVTAQDRWEEDPGYSPFTLAAEISALLTAADMAEANGEPGVGAFLRETADAWNDAVERWTYVSGTELAREHGVDGYYVRISPPETSEAPSPAGGFVAIKNRPPGQGQEAASHIVSPDALALVRFGLRAPDDPRIRDTITVIDALLKVKTPLGPAWHRYNEDGYGEHADGAPFDGTGVGRAWPLITGERAHYELAAGNASEARRLLAALEAFAGTPGLLPEQVWDSAEVPGRELEPGRPSGSAMPLAWAHAEHVKLLRSLEDGRVFDAPPQALARYAGGLGSAAVTPWRPNQKCRSIPSGRTLRVDLPGAATVRWSTDGAMQAAEVRTQDTGLGLHAAYLPTRDLEPGTVIEFSLRWAAGAGPEGETYQVEVVETASPS